VTPSRPYLVRAIYEWILDNGLTPYILVDATMAGVEVPQAYVNEGQIILNIAPQAVQGLELGNEQVGFNARFGGTPTDVWVPIPAIVAIYAQENGRGMVFTEEEGQPPPDAPGPASPGGGRPSLKIVK